MKNLYQNLSRRLLSFAVAIAGVSAGPIAHAACTPPPAGIVAWWPGEGNATDIIGGNNGTLMNGTGFTNGEVGTAFNFNGINNFVLINSASASSLNVGAGSGLTIEGWINPATVTQQQLLAEYERVLGSGDGTDVGVDFAIQSSTMLYADLVENTPGQPGHEIYSPANLLVAGVWQHVALTYDQASGLAALYINGSTVTNMNFGSFTPQTSYTNLVVGARTYLGSASSPNTVYAGAMDELSLYNRALTSNEIAAIYLAGSAGKCQPNPTAPVITQQPTNLTVTVGNTATFVVAATGTAPLSYLWSFNHTNLLGATNATLTLPNVQLSQAGSYAVVVSNLVGSTNSAAATLTILTAPPSITAQPTNQTVQVGGTASFSATVTGTAPLVYQWSVNGMGIAGATNVTLTITNVQSSQAGNYALSLTNAYGSTVSSNAALSVLLTLDHFAWNPISSPQNANQPFGATITAENTHGFTVTNFTGTASLQALFTGGTISNGTFETGALANWTQVTNTGGHFVIDNGTVRPPGGDAAIAPFAGSYSALGEASGPGTFYMYQDISIPSGVSAATLTWAQCVRNLYSSYSSGQGFQVRICDTSNNVLATAFTTAPGYPLLGGWVQTNYNLTAFAGKKVRVMFWVDSTSYYIDALVDNVSLQLQSNLSVTPTNTGNFLNGIWNGNITVQQPATNVVLVANDGSGHTGTSNPFNLVSLQSRPVITSQPTNLTVTASNTAVFAVTATGTAPLSYQWSFNHTNLLGATNSTLTLPNVQLSQAGSYSVVVSNLVGSTNSRAALLTVVNPAPPSCDAPPSGLVAWWPGEGNATDILGGNNGIPLNGIGFTNGEVGNAFNFNGGNGLVLVNPAATGSLDVGQSSGLTIEGWVDPSTISPAMIIAIYENALNTADGANVGPCFLMNNIPNNGSVPGCLAVNIDDTNDVSHIAGTPPNVLVPGVWQHVAFTYNKTSGLAAFYVNGVAVTQTNLGVFTPQTTFTNLEFGGQTTYASLSSPANQFSGQMDELSLYNRALASNEIAAIYLAGSAGKCQPAPLAPVITQQPTNLIVTVSNTATFTVAATGTAPLSYQWSHNHTNLLGATNATLTLPSVQLSQAGNYSVVVSNFVGSTNSLAALLTVVNPTPPSCDAPPSGIVAWWPGQGNAFDIIGTNNGALQGGLGFAPGEVGQAFWFNNTNDDVKIPASPSLNVGAGSGLTLEAWVNCSNVALLNPIFEWNQGDGATYWGVHFYVGAAGPGSLYANVVDSTGNWHTISSATGIVTSNVFTHVALTYDEASGAATLYCNGTIVAQSNLGSFTPLTTYSLYLGRRPGPDSYFTFDGLIDEPSIYNRALSSNQIAAIYQAGSAGKCASPTETVLTMVATNAMSGTTVTMPIFMNALGVENTFLASVGYDPTKLVLNHVQLGEATAGAFLAEVDSQTNNGYVGFAILLNIGATVPVGTQEVAEIMFQSVPTTNTTTVNLTFGDNPTTRQVVDTNLDLLPAAYFGGSITLTPAEYEADVYPRPTGNHQVNVQDWLEVGRMVAGLDTPTNQDEFLRADCAPRNAPDGALTVADWVQAGRYALGLDPLALVAPPQPPVLTPKSNSQDDSGSGRILFISNVSAERGQAVTVPVELVCATNENAVGLTASYNPNQLQLTGVTLGSAMASGRLNINSNLLTGKLGLALALPPGATLPPGTNQVAILQFIASTTASGNVVVTLDDSVVTLQVADQLANALPTVYANGAVVLPAQPALGATGMAGGLQLSWPASSGTFQVQSADNPLGPWTTVSLPIITNGANAAVTVSPTNQQQYFRLQGQ